MKGNLMNCMKLTFGSEGGYVNHPKDPGGPTKFGITLKTLENYRREPCTAEDVKALAPAEAEEILREQYWKKVWGDLLPLGVDYAIFDFAVNSGPAQAIKEAQTILGTARDGSMGAITFNALTNMNPQEFIKKYMTARLGFLQGLSTWSTFGKGWKSRCTSVMMNSLAMVETPAPIVVESSPSVVSEEPDAGGVARTKDTKVQSTSIGAAGITTAISSIVAAISAAMAYLTPYTDVPKVKYILAGLGGLAALLTIVGAVAVVVIQNRHIINGGTV